MIIGDLFHSLLVSAELPNASAAAKLTMPAVNKKPAKTQTRPPPKVNKKHAKKQTNRPPAKVNKKPAKKQTIRPPAKVNKKPAIEHLCHPQTMKQLEHQKLLDCQRMLENQAFRQLMLVWKDAETAEAPLGTWPMYVIKFTAKDTAVVISPIKYQVDIPPPDNAASEEEVDLEESEEEQSGGDIDCG